MANTFISREFLLTTTLSDSTYEPGASTTAIIFSGTVANIDTTNNAQFDVTIEIETATGSAAFRDVLTSVPIPFGSTLILPKMVLETAVAIQAKASAASGLEMHLFILEIT